MLCILKITWLQKSVIIVRRISLAIHKMLVFIANILVGTADCDTLDGIPVVKPVDKKVTLPYSVSISRSVLVNKSLLTKLVRQLVAGLK